MNDILAEALAGDAPTEEAPPEAAEAAPEQASANDVALEQEEPQAEESKPENGKPKALSFEDETAFSDEALSDPESLREARKVIQDKRKQNHSKFLELDRREKRFKTEKAETLQLRDNLRAQFGALQNDIQALRQGDAETAMGALSRLSGGRNAAELFEEISINLARNGKRQPSAEVSELKGEVAELKSLLQQRLQADQQREQQTHIEREHRAIISTVNEAGKFPILASFAKQNPDGVAADVAQYVLHQHRSGVSVDYPAAISHIESELRKHFASAVATPQGGESGRETGAVANPVVPQVGKTIAPSLTTQSAGISRELSEAERLKKAVQESPSGFWEQFGIQ